MNFFEFNQFSEDKNKMENHLLLSGNKAILIRFFDIENSSE